MKKVFYVITMFLVTGLLLMSVCLGQSTDGEGTSLEDLTYSAYQDMVTDAQNDTESATPAMLLMTPKMTTSTTTANYIISIEYCYQDSTEKIAKSYEAQVAMGSTLDVTVASPKIEGYELVNPEDISYHLQISNVTGDYTATVYYKPSYNKFVVVRYFQNVDNDEYVLNADIPTAIYQGSDTTPQYVTNALVKDVVPALSTITALSADDMAGFELHDFDESTVIAADGNTHVDLYYNRKYFTMKLDLNDDKDAPAKGPESFCVRYGSNIKVDNPERAGYTFEGWTTTKDELNTKVDLPETMPADNKTYYAYWKVIDTTEFTIVLWGENADDKNNSILKVKTITDATPNATITYDNYKDTVYPDKVDGYEWSSLWTQDTSKSTTLRVNPNGSSVMNVYFKRKEVELTFKSDNKFKFPVASPVGDSEQSGSYTLKLKWGANISAYWPISVCYEHYQNWEWVTDWQCGKWVSSTTTGVFHKAGTTFLTTMPLENDTLTGYNMKQQEGLFKASSLVTYSVYLETGGSNTEGTTIPESNVNVLKDKTFYCLNGGTQFRATSLELDDVYPIITGFERLYAIPTGLMSLTSTSSSMTISDSNVPVNVYYARKTYELSFNNGEKDIITYPVPYEASIYGSDLTYWTKANEEISKNYPTYYDPSAYSFAGWYETSTLTDGTEAKWDTDSRTMPAGNLTFYAKWEKNKYSVKIYEREGQSTPVFNKTDVEHGTILTKKYDTNTFNPVPTLEGYTFLYWYYYKDGIETRFDPTSMKITEDLKIYAKWDNKIRVTYTVKYVLTDGTRVAEDDVYTGLVGSQKTIKHTFSNF